MDYIGQNVEYQGCFYGLEKTHRGCGDLASVEGTNNLPISVLLAYWAQYKRLWPNVPPFKPPVQATLSSIRHYPTVVLKSSDWF